MAQKTSQDDHEIIVVDNNSRDNTKGMVGSFLFKFGRRLRYLFEPNQGKSYALNLGIKEARGEVLVFTDDDCLVEKDYLAQVEKFFQAHGNAIDFMGGKILPHWVGGDCPAWLAEILSDKTDYGPDNESYWRRIFLRGPLAILDYGNEPFQVDITQKFYQGFLFYGPNMAVRKIAIEKVGGYAVDKTITQDTKMCLCLIRSGMKGWYAPHVRVYHQVNVARLNPQYYYQWYFNRGRFLELSHSFQKKFYHPLGIQFEFILRTFQLFIRSILAPSMRDKVHYRCQGFFNFGQMLQISKKNIA
jgi:glycosyltransferase involved in cell wall biosynthesis